MSQSSYQPRKSELQRKRRAENPAQWRLYKDQNAIYQKNYSLKKLETIAGRPCPELCECCGRPETMARQARLTFDHDHRTGRFRGWICHSCNTVLGRVEDDTFILIMLMSYLVRNGR